MGSSDFLDSWVSSGDYRCAWVTVLSVCGGAHDHSISASHKGTVVDFLRKSLYTILLALEIKRKRFLITLDAERISGFQAFYYPMISFAGVYLWLIADQPTEALLQALGPYVYEGWLTLNIVCPQMTLFGRRLYSKAATVKPGKSNSSYGAAWLQFWGDAGVWGAILIYAACLFNSYFIGQPLYTAFYFLMGIPGGFMFTLRSWRRIHEIHRTEREL